MGTENSNGTTKRNVSPSPGPDVEIIDSSENGPPAQYANSNATNGANAIRRKFCVGAYNFVGTNSREPDGGISEAIAPQLRHDRRPETSKTMRAARSSQHRRGSLLLVVHRSEPLRTCRTDTLLRYL